MKIASTQKRKKVKKAFISNKIKMIPLDTAEDIGEKTVGPKAMSLIRMNRAGLPIPSGFCIPETIFRMHLEENNLISSNKSITEKLDTVSQGAKEMLLSYIRESITEAPLSKIVQEKISNYYQALPAVSLAVRSSATEEDLPGQSFAGQYETYLGITDISSCIKAIKKCWASLWTERAYNYREKNGLDHLSNGMAVIIQALVPSDVSGVVFTVDPVSGQSDKIIIEACFGLGETLVSGKVTPDRMVIKKDNLQIISYDVAIKKTQYVSKQRGGIIEEKISAKLARSQCLNESKAQRLAELAVQAETLFGLPQDIEWAICGDQIFLLQARPITTLSKKKSWEDRQVWTDANVAEILPDVVTPANWKFVKVLVDKMFGSVFSWIGVDLGDNPVIGRIAGRVYFNLNTMAGALRTMPGLRKMDVSRVLGGEQGKMEELGQLSISEEDIPDLKFSYAKMIINFPRFMYKVMSNSPGKAAKKVIEIEQKTRQLQNIDLSSLSDEEILLKIDYAITDVLENVGFLASSALGMFYFTKLDQFCRKSLGDKEGTFANRLLAGVGGMDSAEAGLELWYMAARAHYYKKLEDIIARGNSWKETEKRIKELHDDHGFLYSWNCFMEKHGHHTRGELELANPRWSEQPDYVLDMVRGYLRAIDDTNPLENYRQRVKERIELTKESRNRLNLIKRMIFNFYLKQTQQGCIARENIKSVAVRYWMAGRLIFLELGDRFVAKGIIDKRDDIFFLNFEEMNDICVKQADFDAKRIVVSRKAEYEKYQKITPPKVVMGKFDPDNFIADSVDKNTKVLNGIAVSPGIVTGRARVILKSNNGEKVLPGEILVAPYTDPGWTPYFLPAAAIVMDQGGLLSHGSIVAREYGIPAVVNVGPATKIIKTGQTIQVDGNRGTVKIIR